MGTHSSILGSVLAALIVFGGGKGALAETSMTFLIDTGPESLPAAEALIEAYRAKNPDVSIDIEQRPGGGEGDNLVKTRLATGDMPDVFLYNSGSLMQALKPAATLVPLDDLPSMAGVQDRFKSSVTADGRVYGVPFGPAMAGGIFYNRALYDELGLQVPKTWAEFMANNQKIKAAGKVAVAQTYRDTWTSQLLVLSDFYNVLQAVPDFARRYTANQAKFASTPAALEGFRHLQAVHDGGYLNEDFGAAGYDDGLRMLASGEAAHYPMLTFAIGGLKQNYPDDLDKVGFFAQPGADAAKNGLTVWMPPALYAPSSGRHVEEAKKFLEFVASKEGCETLSRFVLPQGPLLVDGCALPADVPQATKDILPYFEVEGKTAPALEYLSPVKGPSLEQITVEVGSGIRQPAEAAALYDEDVRKQARQLAIPGW